MTVRRSPAESVQRAVAALAGGGMVVVVDDADRENEADLVVPAELVTTAQMAFIVRYTTGIVCAPMPAGRADQLALPTRGWSPTTPTASGRRSR
jgi:3,4-dihydroxy 2-butanone 4-phosphate synthase/GTP cyclohydrolase II